MRGEFGPEDYGLTSKLEIQRNGQVLQSFEPTQIRLVPVSCSEVLQIELKNSSL